MKTTGVGLDAVTHSRSLKTDTCRVGTTQLRSVMIIRELCLAVLVLVLLAVGLIYLARSSPEFHRVINEHDRPLSARAKAPIDRQASIH
jgi:hypothetical protein